MTRKQAQERALALFGKYAKLKMSHHPWNSAKCTYRVGVVKHQLSFETFHTKGKGGSWEEAFADYEQRQKERDANG